MPYLRFFSFIILSFLDQFQCVSFVTSYQCNIAQYFISLRNLFFFFLFFFLTENRIFSHTYIQTAISPPSNFPSYPQLLFPTYHSPCFYIQKRACSKRTSKHNKVRYNKSRQMSLLSRLERQFNGMKRVPRVGRFRDT